MNTMLLVEFKGIKMFYLGLWQFWIVLSICIPRLNAYPDLNEYCMGERFRATCSDNSVVMVTHAVFGSMRSGRCINNAHPCQQDILEYADLQCSGKNLCEFDVTDILDIGIQTIQPCTKNFMSYLEGAYECIDVTPPVIQDCYQHQAVIIKERSGYISSHLAKDNNVGKSGCPWRIEAPTGKRIEVTLIDFGVWSRQHNTVCEHYANLVERSTGEQFKVCGGNNRMQNVYTSKTSTLEIEIASALVGTDRKYFLLKYAYVGCSEYTASGALVTIEGNTASATCIYSGMTWKMTCENDIWLGDKIYCDAAVLGSVLGNDLRTNKGLLMVLCVGIIIGVVLAVFCTCIGMLCVRRCKRQSTNTSTELYMKDRPVPLEPDYHYKYRERQNKFNDPLLQEKNDTFIDPQTGRMYAGYAGDYNKPDILFEQSKPSGTFRMNNLKDNHIYNTLEPRDEDSNNV